MDKDDLNFKSEWLYSGLDDQSEERNTGLLIIRLINTKKYSALLY